MLFRSIVLNDDCAGSTYAGASMKSILEAGIACKLATSVVMTAAKAGAVVLVWIGRWVSGGNDGLSVTVGESLCETLASEVGVQVGINRHLQCGWTSHEREVRLR